MENEHPLALEFLRRDVVNVNEYFDKHEVTVLTTKHAFDFITEFEMKTDSTENEL